MLNTNYIINELENKGFEGLTLVNVTKNGVTMKAICYRPNGSNLGTNAYIDECKNDRQAIALCEKVFRLPQPNVGNPLENFDKSKLCARIFSKGKSGSDIVKPFLDLEICPYYTVLLDKNNGEMGGIKMTSDICSYVGITKDDVIETAIKNSFTDCDVKHIVDVLKELMGVVPFDETSIPMYVITNRSKTGGAINIANTTALAELADKLNDDLWILPSSIHEIIAVPTYLGDPMILKEMVSDVNSTEVKAEDKLSDSVYRFYKDKKVVTIA